jgi:hypothetical protein
MGRGQEFSFLASPGCATLRFSIRGTPVVRTPLAGPGSAGGLTTYKVVLNERE